MSDTDRMITIAAFRQMLGVSRDWFYDHAEDPGFPQRVYVGAAPRLMLSECVAYVEALKNKRGPKAPLPRKGGRPRTNPPAAA